MMFVSKKEGRINQPVVLRIKLEAVSRPGVLFSDSNATRSNAVISDNPDIVRFENAKAESMFSVPELVRPYYQAEVLVPSPLPPHLIVFPRQPKSKLRKEKSNLAEKEFKRRMDSDDGMFLVKYKAPAIPGSRGLTWIRWTLNLEYTRGTRMKGRKRNSKLGKLPRIENRARYKGY
jgi:hypothetical protein